MATAQPDTTVQTDKIEQTDVIEQKEIIEQPDSTGVATEESQANEPSSLEAKIIKQIEFYFGDKNLPRDKFLLRILHEEGNEAGWVALDNLLNFNRLKKLSTDIPFIAIALRQSTSGLLEVFEDNTKIRRITPIPETTNFAFFDHDKSIYAKGFPLESTIDELESFFESFGKINLIKLRTFQNRKFKGSVFIEFSEESVATDFVKNDAIRFKDIELIRFMKKDYLEKKAIEYQENKKNFRIQKSEKLREKTQDDHPFIKGALLKLEGLPNTTRREEIKEHFGQDNIGFVDMSMGDSDCTIMFKAENGAKDAIGINEDDTLEFKESIITYQILDGEIEQNEWVRLCQLLNSLDKRQNKSRPSRDRGGRGGGKWGARSHRGFGSSRKGRGGFRSFEKNRDGEDNQGVVLGKRRRNEDEPQPKHTRMANPDSD